MFYSSDLIFDHLKEEDAEFTFKMRNGNYEHSKTLIISPFPTSLQREKEWIRNLYSDSSKAYFGIRQKGNSELTGFCFLNKIDLINRNAKTGIIISEEFCGKGYGTQAINFISNYGFNELGLKKIQATILKKNLASQKIFKKNNYSEEAIFTKQYFISGCWEDCLIYSRFSEE